jgi:hypothetical protein
LHGGDETGEASKIKQVAYIASLTRCMLGAGGMANYVVRASTCYAFFIFPYQLSQTLPQTLFVWQVPADSAALSKAARFYV